MLKTGLEVKLAKTLDLAAVIHIQRLANGNLQFTAVPLLYGSYALKDGEGTFSLQPPPGINLIAGLPVIRGPSLDQTLQMYAEYQRQNTPVSTALDQPATTPASTPPPASELVRLNANPAPEISVPMHAQKGKGHGSPTPPAEIAAAAPAATQPAAGGPTLAMENPPPARVETPDVPVARAEAVEPGDRAEPAQPADSYAAPGAALATGAQLTPFLQSAPAPILTNNDATWRTYSPGQMPRGRIIDPENAAPLADSGMGGERLYLRGNFVVTASEENRAVLRSQSGGAQPDSGTRVVVEYPAGVEPPVEGSAFARDENRPFLITDVRRGADGQINLYVREITTQ
jgi:hypothetical protein